MTETKAFPRFQTSYMVGPLQIVVRDDDAESFAQSLEAVGALVPLIDTVGEKINPPKVQTMEQGVDLVKQELGGQVIGEYRNCAHGQMQWKEGVSKSTNKPYKGWFCPVRNGCSPIFER